MTEANNIILDNICDDIYSIISSRDTEAYTHLLSIITLSIEVIAEQFKDMSAITLVNRIRDVIEHDEQAEQEGGDICDTSINKHQ